MERTVENWTYGIVNIPLLYGYDNKNGVTPKTFIRKVAHNARCYSRPYYALNKKERYLWFESDSLDIEYHTSLLRYFESAGIDVFWHRTMKGYHYITLHSLTRVVYELLIQTLKQKFNNGTFYYSLRIVPNKWVGEKDVWKIGEVIDNGSGHFNKLRYVQEAMLKKYYFNYNKEIPETVQMLDNMFCISRYEFKKHLLNKPIEKPPSFQHI